MTEFREVSEEEALAPRPSTRSEPFKPVRRDDLAWRSQVAVVGTYVIMWRVWNVVASSVWRRQRLQESD